MIVVGMGDDGLMRWFPLVYIKIALPGMQADIGELNQSINC
jgi:hypothetical protein